jgi:hypothetical protein
MLLRSSFSKINPPPDNLEGAYITNNLLDILFTFHNLIVDEICKSYS